LAVVLVMVVVAPIVVVVVTPVVAVVVVAVVVVAVVIATIASPVVLPGRWAPKGAIMGDVRMACSRRWAGVQGNTHCQTGATCLVVMR
jgi:hypothetical protein